MAEQSDQLDRWLIRACALLIALDLLHIPLGLASIPRYYQRVTTLTIPPYGVGIGNTLTNESVMADAAIRGMPLPVFALYFLGIHLLAAIIFTAVGGLVLWRGRGDWFIWFTAHVMFFLNSWAFYSFEQAALLLPSVIIDLGSVFWPTFLLFVFLFPNGQVVPRWMRWPLLLYMLVHFALQLVGTLASAGYFPKELFEAVLAPGQVGILIVFTLVLGCQVYRYTRVSSPVERAQTRWFVMGIAVIIFVPLIGEATGAGQIFQTFEWGTLSLALIPITLAIAILRYRLWDIDIIIRRTLQYTLLSGLLALIYFGAVTVLQSIFTAVSGQQSAASLVLSTLAIAALFNPLRKRIQDFIDKRFYRQRYDAEQALASFAEAARRETELQSLTSRLTATVQETLQPGKVDLWLRK